MLYTIRMNRLIIGILIIFATIGCDNNSNKYEGDTLKSNDYPDYPNFNPKKWNTLIKKQLPSLKNERIILTFDLENRDNIDTSNLFDFVIGIFINSCEFDSLPKDFLLFPNIQEIDLVYTKIDTLHSWIGDFEHLKRLSIYDSQLKYIPKSIGNLKTLEELELFRSSIQNIPPEIGSLTQLTDLRISSNNISIFHNEWGNLKNLKRLEISEQKLDELPKFVLELVELEYLKISGNLTSLPDEISNLKKLKKLDCTFNNIDSIQRQHINDLLPNTKIEFEY